MARIINDHIKYGNFQVKNRFDDQEDYALRIVLDDLLKLRRWCIAEPSSISKTEGALRAIHQASALFTHLIGWALCHEAGRALAIEDPAENSTDYEALGRCLTSNHPEDARIRRAILIRLLEVQRATIPFSDEVLDSLAALDFGEAYPLVARTKTSQRSSYALAKLRLKAVQLVHYLAAQGRKKLDAEQSIADAFGQSSETIRSWQKRSLSNVLGTAALDRAIAEAQMAGDVQKAFLSGKTRADIDDGWSLFIHAQLSEHPPKYWGDLYIEALKAAESARD